MPEAALTAVDWLTLLALGAAAGILGQLARTVVGLKKASDSRAAGAPDSGFDGQRLGVSIAIGGTAGAIAALATGVDPNAPIHAQTVLGLAAAGYAGADFIEGAMRRAVPKTESLPATPAAPAPVEPAPPRSPDDPAGEDFLG